MHLRTNAIITICDFNALTADECDALETYINKVERSEISLQRIPSVKAAYGFWFYTYIRSVHIRVKVFLIIDTICIIFVPETYIWITLRGKLMQRTQQTHSVEFESFKMHYTAHTSDCGCKSLPLFKRRVRIPDTD